MEYYIDYEAHSRIEQQRIWEQDVRVLREYNLQVDQDDGNRERDCQRGGDHYIFCVPCRVNLEPAACKEDLEQDKSQQADDSDGDDGIEAAEEFEEVLWAAEG